MLIILILILMLIGTFCARTKNIVENHTTLLVSHVKNAKTNYVLHFISCIAYYLVYSQRNAIDIFTTTLSSTRSFYMHIPLVLGKILTIIKVGSNRPQPLS